MDNEISLHEGEILRILIRRSGKKVDDIAPLMGIVPNSLSRIFRSEKLTSKQKRLAANALDVDVSIFETGQGISLPDMTKVEEPAGKYANVDPDVLEENRRLKEELERTINDLMEALKVAKNR